MRTVFFLILALGLLFAAGCEEYEYTIEMRFEDGRIIRRVICSENMPDDVRARLKEIYETQIDKNTFEGSFPPGRLPQDVGGFANCSHLSNPMGQTYIYHERFRGKDAQAQDIQHAFNSVDKLLGLVIEWLEMELGNHPDFETLQNFCNGQLRADLKDICIYTWMDSRVSDPNSDEAPYRIMQFLYEREYFTLDDIARLTAIPDDGDAILSFIRQIIARKMGYENEDAVSKELSFLANGENALKSLHRFIRNSDTIRNIMADIPEPEKKKQDELDPNDIIEQVMQYYEIDFDTFFLGGISSRDQVNVILNVSHKPYETNGQWDPEKQQITWTRKIGRDGQVDIPFFCYTAFAKPNEGFQKKHFGKIIIQDESLGTYCLWYKNLTAKQQQEWDQCLRTLKGQPDIWKTLEAFRFSDLPECETDSDGNPTYITTNVLRLMHAGWKNN